MQDEADLQDVLVTLRGSVLRACRYATLLGTVGLLPALVHALANGLEAGALIVELMIWIGGSVALWLTRKQRVQVGGLIVTITFLPVCVAALMYFGPLMGTGAMFICWVMVTVFLVDALVAPLVILALVLLAVGVLVFNGDLHVQWSFLPDGLTGWARVCVTTWLIAASLGYVFQRLLRRLVDAARAAAAARLAQEAEADGRRARQRLELLGTLAGGVAHDFNNILTVMSASLDSLRHANNDGERAALLDELDASSEAARATTHQLLSFSRQGQSPSGAADPMRSLPVFANTLRRILPESIALDCDFMPVPPVAIATGAFEQALLSLCLRARDAMPGGGKLTLRTRLQRSSGEADLVRVEVEDDGVGMDDATKVVGLSTGLGLSIVQDAITACAGQLSITSAPTRGTLVCVVLPVAPLVVLATPTPELVLAAPVSPSAAKILLLEDDPAVQRAFALTLRKQGYDVMVTACVAEAEAAVASGVAFDLFLSDAVLPDGNPGALIRRIRTLDPTRPILVCSGHLLDDVMIQGVAQEEFHFLQKPALPSTLRRVVGELLDASAKTRTPRSVKVSENGS